MVRVRTKGPRAKWTPLGEALATDVGPVGDTSGSHSTAGSREKVKRPYMLSKKEGAGGKFTWGGILDVTDFGPIGANAEAKVRVSESADGNAIRSSPEIPVRQKSASPELRPVSAPSSSSSSILVSQAAQASQLPENRRTSLGISDTSQFPELRLSLARPPRPGFRAPRVRAGTSSSSSSRVPVTQYPRVTPLNLSNLASTLTPPQLSPASLRSHISRALTHLNAQTVSSQGGFSSVPTGGLRSQWGSACSTMLTSPAMSFALPSPAMSLSTSPRTWMPAGLPLASSPPSTPEPVAVFSSPAHTPLARTPPIGS